MVDKALSFALDKAGSNIPARIAMMAMTTNNSMRVKPSRKLRSRRLRDAGEGFMQKGLLNDSLWGWR
jgi:hypothetical protein